VRTRSASLGYECHMTCLLCAASRPCLTQRAAVTDKFRTYGTDHPIMARTIQLGRMPCPRAERAVCACIDALLVGYGLLPRPRLVGRARLRRIAESARAAVVQALGVRALRSARSGGHADGSFETWLRSSPVPPGDRSPSE